MLLAHGEGTNTMNAVSRTDEVSGIIWHIFCQLKADGYQTVPKGDVLIKALSDLFDEPTGFIREVLPKVWRNSLLWNGDNIFLDENQRRPGKVILVMSRDAAQSILEVARANVKQEAELLATKLGLKVGE